MKRIHFFLLFLFIPTVALSSDFLATFSSVALDTYYQGNLKALTPELHTTLKKNRLCQTDCNNKQRASSIQFRKLAYEALHNCGHPCPEIVSITNDASKQAIPIGSGLCVIEGAQAVGINFNENSAAAKANYGVVRIILHHESWHIACQHHALLIARDENYYKKKQEREIEADHKAIQLAQCKQCGLECAAYFLKCHATNNRHRALQKYNRCTVQNLEAITTDRIMAIIFELTALSRARSSQHPLDIERALRIYVDSRALGNVLCFHHKNLVNTAKKRP